MPTDGKSELREAVILCGGFGVRLRGVVHDRPKALAEVRGRPFLEWLILRLARCDDVNHIVLATGYLGDMIEAHFGDSPWCGVNLSYSREGQPLGTAGALRLAMSHTSAPRLLVLNGDTFCRYDLDRLLDAHLRNRAAASLWLVRPKDLSRYGNVAMDTTGSIRAFHEKAAEIDADLASAGVYLIERNVIIRIQPGRTVSLERDVFPSLVGRGLYGLEGEGRLIDIGTPESLASADTLLTDELGGLNCD